MVNSMTASERFIATLNFEATDRMPIIEWADYWNLTVKRWEQEGMPTGMDNEAIQRYFGLDVVVKNWAFPGHRNLKAPEVDGGPIISNEAEYDKLLEDGMLYPDCWTNDGDLEQWETWNNNRQKLGDTILRLSFEGFFWFPRRLLGIEPHMFAFYDQPELMHRINHDLAEYNLKYLEDICKIAKPDFITFGEDMSYNNGPMLSEEQFNEFMLPYYNMIMPKIKELNIKVIIDSDGDITTCAEWFRRAGADGMLPLERQAGVDINVLLNKYPDMCWLGAFDKMVMNKGEAAIRAEFERLLPVAKQGGLVISCDHQTPPGVSLEQYHNYLQCFREYM